MQAPLTQRFPGMRFAARKVALGRALGWVEALCPGSLPFSPRTWLLPDELGSFAAQESEEVMRDISQVTNIAGLLLSHG